MLAVNKAKHVSYRTLVSTVDVLSTIPKEVEMGWRVKRRLKYNPLNVQPNWQLEEFYINELSAFQMKWHWL